MAGPINVADTVIKNMIGSIRPTTGSLAIKALQYALVAYIFICLFLYLFQENFIFFPEKLSGDHRFQFNQRFQEKFIATKEGKKIHGLLFTADSSKGLVFFLHGNAGSLDSWGGIAGTYLKYDYDVFILDYGGYGKSEGRIRSEKQFYDDVQTCYDHLKKSYEERNIIVAGYSIGTGPAAYLAAHNGPQLLLLHAPYYNLPDLMRQHYPIIPTFLLKYKFKTNEFITRCKMPVIVFHGDADRVIPLRSSLKLQQLFKQGDDLIVLKNQGHNGILENPGYDKYLPVLLSN